MHVNVYYVFGGMSRWVEVHIRVSGVCVCLIGLELTEYTTLTGH